MLSPLEIAKQAFEALDQKSGKDIKVLKIEALSILANYFVICTAGNTTHIKTLADELEKVLEQSGERPLRREGYRAGGWVLLDYGCVVIHLFLDEVRQFYNLERVWGDAEEVQLTISNEQ